MRNRTNAEGSFFELEDRPTPARNSGSADAESLSVFADTLIEGEYLQIRKCLVATSSTEGYLPATLAGVNSGVA
jgi:hypothetical protein